MVESRAIVSMAPVLLYPHQHRIERIQLNVVMLLATEGCVLLKECHVIDLAYLSTAEPFDRTASSRLRPFILPSIISSLLSNNAKFVCLQQIRIFFSSSFLM